MSKSVCGSICQNAYVVSDIDYAIEYWVTRMGVGPFFKFPAIDFIESDYLGRSQPFEFEAALAFSGDLQIELIRPKGPSIFQEFADAGFDRLHHLCRITTDMPAAHTEMQSAGAQLVQRGMLSDGSIVAYYNLGRSDGMMMELAYLKPELLHMFETLKQAAEKWDGHTRTISF